MRNKMHKSVQLNEYHNAANLVPRPECFFKFDSQANARGQKEALKCWRNKITRPKVTALRLCKTAVYMNALQEHKKGETYIFVEFTLSKTDQYA